MPPPPVSPVETRALLARLRPMETDTPLIRVGRNSDGGYLVPDDLDGIVACFSPGVSKIATFEATLLKRGIPSFLADASVDGPPPELAECVFIKKFLGPKTEGDHVSLDDWVRENAPPDGDLLLQMDIEGHEYETIGAASPEILKRFRIVVVEIHGIPRWSGPHFHRRAKTMLDALLNDFTLVHVHPNNCCGTANLARVEVPRVAELTFLRNDRVRGARPARGFPHPLDRANVGHAEDLVLPRDLWADDSPLFSGGRQRISTGSPFEAQIGYSRAVAVDGWVFVSGTTGYDYATMTLPDDIEAQCRNAVATIAKALADAGGSLDDVVRVRYIVPDAAEWPRCWPILAEAFGTARPAATMIACALQEPGMKIEIEATARLER